MEKIANKECPVCFKAMHLSPRVYQCVNGHIICEPCSGRLTECPQCRETLLGQLIRNLFAEEILEDISYDCSHKKNGCMEKLTRGGIKDHESACIYGSSFDLCDIVRPDISGCNFKITAGNAKSVLEHFRSCHRNYAKGISENKTLLLKVNNRQEGRKCYIMRPFPEKDSLLLVILTVGESSVAFSVVDLSLDLSAEDDVQVMFAVPDDKAPLISMQIAAISGIDSWRFMKKEGSPTQLKIDKESLTQHCDKEGKVKITVKVKSAKRGKGKKLKRDLEWLDLSFELDKLRSECEMLLY